MRERAVEARAAMVAQAEVQRAPQVRTARAQAQAREAAQVRRAKMEEAPQVRTARAQEVPQV